MANFKKILRIKVAPHIKGKPPLSLECSIWIYSFLSIEHIMPQTLSNEWKHKLGGEQAAERIRKLWGHTIADLILTAYNSSYSNSSFDKKLNLISDDGQGIGFKYSPLHLNEYIKQQTSWGGGRITRAYVYAAAGGSSEYLLDFILAALSLQGSLISSFCTLG
mgnify:CR=1 FL=1